MTISAIGRNTIPLPYYLDRGMSADADELRDFTSRFGTFDTSISLGLLNSATLNSLRDAFLSALQEDWDGYDALQADPSSIPYALELLQQLPSIIPMPEIAIDVDGEIAIEWDLDRRRVLSLRVGRDGTIRFSSLIGHTSLHGSDFLRDSIPSPIVLGIERTVSGR